MDLLLVRFINDDGSTRGRFDPDAQISYLRPAHLKARRAGLIRASGERWSFAGSRGGSYMWHLTPKGEEEAKAALKRVVARRAERKLWSEDCKKAFADHTTENTNCEITK